MNRARYATVTEALKPFQDSPLLFAPGTRYSYSSYGYNLVGAVIEGAARSDFFACVRRQVLDPLRMESTILDEPEEIVPGRSRFYSLVNGRLQNGPFIYLSDRRPSGGFLSSASDMSRFAAAHLTDALLKPATRQMLFTSQKTTDGKETGVGWGWRIAGIDGEKVYHHGGESVGGRAFVLLRPERQVAAAITCNLSFAKIAEEEAMAISNLFVR